MLIAAQKITICWIIQEYAIDKRAPFLLEYISFPYRKCNIPDCWSSTIKYQNRIKRMKRIVSNVLINYPLQHTTKLTMRNAHSITKKKMLLEYRIVGSTLKVTRLCTSIILSAIEGYLAGLIIRWPYVRTSCSSFRSHLNVYICASVGGRA